MTSALGSDLQVESAETTGYFRPSEMTFEGREVVFASKQHVVMGTHPNIPDLIIIGNLGSDLPEEFVAPALSHEEIHNALNKLGACEKEASVDFLDRIGSAVTELESSGLASEEIVEARVRQFRARKVLNRFSS